MFNPTIIRLCTFGAYTGMVVAPSDASEDNFFQVYLHKAPNDKTELIDSQPYGRQVEALGAFEVWARDMDMGLRHQRLMRSEPELDQQTNHDAPPLNDMDDPDDYENDCQHDAPYGEFAYQGR